MYQPTDIYTHFQANVCINYTIAETLYCKAIYQYNHCWTNVIDTVETQSLLHVMLPCNCYKKDTKNKKVKKNIYHAKRLLSFHGLSVQILCSYRVLTRTIVSCAYLFLKTYCNCRLVRPCSDGIVLWFSIDWTTRYSYAFFNQKDKQ